MTPKKCATKHCHGAFSNYAHKPQSVFKMSMYKNTFLKNGNKLYLPERMDRLFPLEVLPSQKAVLGGLGRLAA